MKQAALLVVGVVGLLVGAWWQPGQFLSPDSATYVVAARQIAAGEGLTTTGVLYGDTAPIPLTQFAPGFPALIAAMPGDARQGASTVLVASLAGLGVGTVALFLLLSDGREAWLAALAGLVAVLSPANLEATHRLLSDLPGATVVVFAATALVAAVKRGGAGAAAGAGVALGLCLLMRWSNLYVVVGGVGGLLVLRRWKDAGVAAAAAAVTAGPWLLRNLVVGGSVFGERRGASAGLLDALMEAPRGLFAPFYDPDFGVGGLGLMAAVVFLAAGAAAQRGAWSPRMKALAALIGAYAVLLVASRAAVHFDPLSEPRFWLPVAALLVAAGGAFVDRPLPVLGALVLCLIAFGWGAAEQHGDLRADRGWAAQSWRISVQKIVPRAGDRTLLTNDRRILSLHAPGRLAVTLPESPEELHEYPAGDAPCVLLFTKGIARSVKRKDEAFRRSLKVLRRDHDLQRVGRTKRSELWCSID